MTMGIVDQDGRESAMRKDEKTKTGFVRVNPRDLPGGDLEELLVGPIDDDGFSEGFSVVWSMLDGHRVARVSAYADAWNGMMRCAHLLRVLPAVPQECGASGHPTVEQVIEALKAAGCEDHTRPSPYPPEGGRE